ncbi:glycosyltransferase [cf. Phormidesmis sp. LEGE 11477]|uniref:glycosyltransferase n=1 Tax=cf. Phormidesmis sp. LEGE 11477 TaxID=1828680 RepID=UPI001881F301|nr:glycosyltransferase [cf. Phormidesmis sp. LEGE 11477]MBE9060885.1 glycosyltransferase [cf. Phormidesmis sp. LEGE 11477]
MKIAIIGLLHHPIAEPFAGGMESHTWWLAKKLIEKGHDVTLFASGDSDPELGLWSCIEHAFVNNLNAQTLLGRQACNMSAYASVIRQLCQQPFDVVHNNALHPFLLLSAADLPMPMLTVLHTPVYKELADAVRYASARNTLNRLLAVSVSNSLAKDWKPLIDSDVVYNGIDVESWPMSANTLAKKQAKQALWYGRFVPEKAPHLAMRAALKAGYNIEIAGPIGDQDYFEKEISPLLEDVRVGRTGSNRVTYLGHLTHAQIKQALLQATVFVNTPMWEEPYGFVYAEALASGTPVATFRSGAAEEILTSQCGVMVEERTAEALAGAVSAAAKLSHQDCRRRAATFCHIDAMIESYEKRYRQLVVTQRRLDQRKPHHVIEPMQSLVGIAS